MRAWRFVHGQAGCEETYAMMQAREGLHRRRDGAKYLDNLVRAKPTVADTRAYAELMD